MDEKIETWTLRFPAKEYPNKQKELFNWPIVFQYDVKAKYRLISRKFSSMFNNQPKATRVCVRSINQSNRSISVRLFLFRSCVFISRSYENRSIECFHSRGQHLCKFIGTKENVCIRKEFISQRIGLGHQHGRRFIVLGHQYGRRDVMWKHSIEIFHSHGQQLILC